MVKADRVNLSLPWFSLEVEAEFSLANFLPVLDSNLVSRTVPAELAQRESFEIFEGRPLDFELQEQFSATEYQPLS